MARRFTAEIVVTVNDVLLENVTEVPSSGTELLDSFKRAPEKPLSNGGKWSESESAGLGEIASEAWQPTNEYAGIYWNPTQFIETGVSVELHHLAATEGNNTRLFIAEEPAASGEIKKGYAVELEEEGAGKFAVKLLRKTANSVLASTTAVTFAVGDRLGLSVDNGKVIAWRKVGAGAWEELLSASDSTYTKGYVGLFARKSFTFRNFEVGPIS